MMKNYEMGQSYGNGVVESVFDLDLQVSALSLQDGTNANASAAGGFCDLTVKPCD